MCILQNGDEGGGGFGGGFGGSLSNALQAGMWASSPTGGSGVVGGSGSRNGFASGFDVSSYLKQYADIGNYYDAEAVRDKDFAARFPTKEEFASWHYETKGQGEIAAGTRAPLAVGGGTLASTDADAAEGLLTNLTGGANKATEDLRTDNEKLLDALNTAGTNLTSMIGQMGANFARSQAELIARMQDTAAKQSAAQAKAIKDAEDAVGQREKRPTFGKALDKNKKLNSGGLGSTSLTGPGGVPAGSMTLGLTSLLGGGR